MSRFCVILTEDEAQWKERTYGDMFIDGLKQEGDSWTVLSPAMGDSLAHVLNEGYDGIVVTGSHYNVSDNLPWYEPLCNIIRHAAKIGAPRMYGGCFGHQIIAHALGGQVGKNPRFVMKAETIQLLPAFSKLFSIDATSFKILEVHGDCVLTLPPEAELLGRSDSCSHESYVAGPKKNILCCQGHPEFDVQYCFKERLWHEFEERLGDKRDESKLSFDTYIDHDAKRFLKLISQFLRHKYN
ncbi:hypothetical protein AeMF1_009818 [Aphanomyces euteiches]|nr:hypothetical protein AeMF1_009818 [Aphanomyces euteiches]KAH9187767.1 hypothetical protein AeNC1_010256 [Aphanomyces euteiches]